MINIDPEIAYLVHTNQGIPDNVALSAVEAVGVDFRRSKSGHWFWIDPRPGMTKAPVSWGIFETKARAARHALKTFVLFGDNSSSDIN